MVWSITEGYENDAISTPCGTFWSSIWDSKTNSEEVASGSHACKMIVYEGANGWGGGVSFLQHSEVIYKGGELWVRWRQFMPLGFNYGVFGEGDTLKFLRLEMRGGPVNAKWELELTREGSFTPFGVYVDNNACDSYANCWDFIGVTSDQPQKGVWETYEVYVKLDDQSVDDGGTGRGRLWKNGILIGEFNKNATLNDPSQYYVSAQFFTYWNGGAPQTQHLYFDDLVITNGSPGDTDAVGNPYIGTGDFVQGPTISSPNPPTNVG